MAVVVAAIAIFLAVTVQLGFLGFWICLAVSSALATYAGVRRADSPWLLVGIAGIGICAWLMLLSATSHPREGARRANCINNMRNIVLALLQYHDSQGTFPPAYIADANGRPMHSWRVLILPYLDQKVLYRTYRFDEPWDGPNNRKLHDTVMKIYSCPSHDEKQPKTNTSYVAVIGPQTMWPDEKCVKMSDVKDGTSNTILIVEAASSGIHWIEPRDLHALQMAPVINPLRGQGISSHHKGGATVGFADGSIRYVVNGVPAETIQAAITRSGKEPPPKEPER
jgi:prepilin-type processing-associated H-X9-DG protein